MRRLLRLRAESVFPQKIGGMFVRVRFWGAGDHDASVAGKGGERVTEWSRFCGCGLCAAGHVSPEYAFVFVRWEKQQPDNPCEKCVYHGDG